MASPRPALVISRRAGRTTPADTRGWMGGVSRRAILSIRPETFFFAVSETSLKVTRSLACKCIEGLHTGRGFVKMHIALFRGHYAPLGVILEPPGYLVRVEHSPCHIHAEFFQLSLRGLDLVAERGQQVSSHRHAGPLVAINERTASDEGLAKGGSRLERSGEVLPPERRSPRPLYGCFERLQIPYPLRTSVLLDEHGVREEDTPKIGVRQPPTARRGSSEPGRTSL